MLYRMYSILNSIDMYFIPQLIPYFSYKRLVSVYSHFFTKLTCINSRFYFTFYFIFCSYLISYFLYKRLDSVFSHIISCDKSKKGGRQQGGLRAADMFVAVAWDVVGYGGENSSNRRSTASFQENGPTNTKQASRNPKREADSSKEQHSLTRSLH